MNLGSLHSRSLAFAEREVEICRFTAHAAVIYRQEATTSREVHAGNQLLRETTARFKNAKAKHAWEIRQLS